uniref:Uncharacterized protein n=1 Tax=Aegilops tauschii subsp. strangulata TaxID=200361 RepID=A0A453IN02_AEGTS
MCKFWEASVHFCNFWTKSSHYPSSCIWGAITSSAPQVSISSSHGQWTQYFPPQSSHTHFLFFLSGVSHTLPNSKKESRVDAGPQSPPLEPVGPRKRYHHTASIFLSPARSLLARKLPPNFSRQRHQNGAKKRKPSTRLPPFTETRGNSQEPQPR